MTMPGLNWCSRARCAGHGSRWLMRPWRRPLVLVSRHDRILRRCFVGAGRVDTVPDRRGQSLFALPESREFLLAGGAGLVAQGLTTRATQDLDFFTVPGRDRVPVAREALKREALRQGWSVRVLRDHDTFCRLVLGWGSEQVLVDLAVDSAPGRPTTVGVLGPTFSAEELSGRKTIALFDRAEARDFADWVVELRSPS
ncbi:MAG TPA: nucleotidyl transferase AbiEii/AbiGii toxin family protein [Kineosporiaceae bacterium]|nr:nucleotidyl transferase AbiEii/AbiGii toxin family protein [Kineosporiaceae bacterium]